MIFISNLYEKECSLSKKDFILKLVQLIKGTLIGKVIFSLISGGLTLLGNAPFFDKYISAALSKYLSIEASDPSLPIGLALVIFGIMLTVWERNNILSIELKKLDADRIDDALKIDLKENQFFSFKDSVEKNCYTTIRRLIDKHHDIGYNPESIKELGRKSLYGDDQAVIKYIDFILLSNSSEKIKLDFMMILGDASSQPIIYKFIKQYQELIKRSELDGYHGIIKGTPLYQAYSNIIHPAFIDLRRKARWEDFV